MFENITLNMSLFSSMDNFANNHTCVLNQMSMMRATNNMYISEFWIALLMFAFLVFYFWIQPKFKVLEEFCGIDTLRSVAGLNILLVLMLLYTNLGLSEKQVNIINQVLSSLLIIIGLWLAIYWYKRLKDEVQNP